MIQAARLLTTLLIPAFMLAGAVAGPAMAQDKAKDTKAAPAAKAQKGASTVTVVMENDKVRAFEVLFKPGDENKAVPSANFRIVRALKGGSLTRTYADGKTEKNEYKTGQVWFNEPTKVGYTVKNVGKSDVQLYVVVLK